MPVMKIIVTFVAIKSRINDRTGRETRRCTGVIQRRG